RSGGTSQSGTGGSRDAVGGPANEGHHLYTRGGSVAAAAASQAKRIAKSGLGAGAKQVHGGSCRRGPGSGGGEDSRAAVGARSAVRSAGDQRGEERRAGELPARPRRVNRREMARRRALQGYGHAHYRVAAAAAPLA